MQFLNAFLMDSGDVHANWSLFSGQYFCSSKSLINREGYISLRLIVQLISSIAYFKWTDQSTAEHSLPAVQMRMHNAKPTNRFSNKPNQMFNCMRVMANCVLKYVPAAEYLTFSSIVGPFENQLTLIKFVVVIFPWLFSLSFCLLYWLQFIWINELLL